MKHGHLGQFELNAILAILRCGNNAYGLEIQKELKEHTGREYVLGAISTTLHRLEQSGLVTSRLGDADSDRLGRPRRYFTVTALGETAMRDTLHILDSLRAGLEPEYEV